MPLGQHVICQLEDKRVIAPTPETRLMVTRLVFSMARSLRLLAYHLVDSHLHLLLLELRARSMQFARHLESAITQRLKLDVGFARAYPEPIRDQRHLSNAFDYVLRQQSRHGLRWDACLEASNLPDLLRMRLLGRDTEKHLRAHLPRVRREMLLKHYGIEQLDPTTEPLELLGQATRGAAGLRSLAGSSREQRCARVAALAVAGERLPVQELATQLEVSPRTLQRLRRYPADPTLARAITLQLALRRELRDREKALVFGAAQESQPSAGKDQRRGP